MPEDSRLLCCVNGSVHAARAVELACALSRGLDKGLTFILVNQVRPASGFPPIRTWPPEEARQILDSAVRYARSHGASDVKTALVEAPDVADAILEYARTHDTAHIVLGTGNPPFIGRLLIGSVSDAVISGARCSVTLAR